MRRLTTDRNDDLLVGVFDGVIYPLDTARETPIDLDINGTDGGVDVTVAMADAGTLPQVGAVPKAVSLNDLRLSCGQRRWRCAVTQDV